MGYSYTSLHIKYDLARVHKQTFVNYDLSVMTLKKQNIDAPFHEGVGEMSSPTLMSGRKTTQ